MPRMLMLAMMLCLADVANAAVNKCKDKTGAVIYSEQPCDKVGATKVKELSKADLKGTDVTREELLKFFEGRVAKWWIPDDVAFVEALPHTATGKLLKTKLREDFRHHRLPTA